MTKKENGIFVCRVCGENFKSWVGIRSHTKKRHSDVTRFTCNECGQLFPRKSKKCYQHINRTCRFCSKVFVCQSILKDHLNVHSGFKQYQCNECSLQFYSKTVLRSHIHRRHEVVSHPCCECNKNFMNQCSNCLQHQRQGRINPCGECKRQFIKKYDDCSKHILICENGGGYKTSDKAQLKVHCNSLGCHPDKPCLQEYLCAVCNKGFSTENNKRNMRKYTQMESLMNTISALYNSLSNMH